MAHFALRCTLGPSQGTVFPLPLDADFVIGRAADLDLILDDQLASRRHAKLRIRNGRAIIEDLNAQNGTYVNGNRVTRKALKTGDKLQIGGTVMELVEQPDSDPRSLTMPPTADFWRTLSQTSAQPTVFGARPLMGRLEGFNLPEMLEYLCQDQSQRVLKLRGDVNDGAIHLFRGDLFTASIDDFPRMSARKALYRMLTWTSGSFEVQFDDGPKPIQDFTGSRAALIFDGIRERDEVANLMAALDLSVDTVLALTRTLSPRFRDLKAEQLDMLQLVIHSVGNLGETLDRYPGTDLEALRLLEPLLRAEYFGRATPQ